MEESSDKTGKKRKRQKDKGSFAQVEKKNLHFFKIFDENTEKIVKSSLFSPYKLKYVAKLGEGTFCRVILVKNRPTGEYFVLKAASKEKILQSKSQKNTLLTENNLLKHMESCVGIPKTYGNYQDDNYFYLLEEYIKGETLLDWFSRGKNLTEYDIFCIFYSLLTILKSIHSRGVIHHDIKCENIMICEEEKKVILIDFGLSEVVHDRKSPYCISSSGTIEYMAPEKINYDPKGERLAYNGFLSDLYSLGVVLFCIIFSRFPYSKDEILKKIKEKNDGYPPFKKREIETVSDELLDFIVSLVSFNPKNRLRFDQVESHTWFSVYKKIYDAAILNAKSQSRK
jgi:serine/threonine protein kinase